MEQESGSLWTRWCCAEVTGDVHGSGFPSSAGAVVLAFSSLGFVCPSLMLLQKSKNKIDNNN